MKQLPSIRRVAEALYGEANRTLSNARELRMGRKGSLSLDLAGNRFYDFETATGGGVLDLVIHAGEARTRKEAYDWLERDGWIDRPQGGARSDRVTRRRQRNDSDAEGKRKGALAIWRQSRPIENTLGARYLAARSIEPPYPSGLGFVARCWNGERREHLPALIAAVTPLTAPNDVCAVHRTYLAEPGRKAELAAPKMALGRIGGMGVVLGEILEALCVGEGIESALSAGRALDLPAIAALGASNMTSLIMPPSVRRVVIAFDRDKNGAGERAASQLALRLHREGRTVQLAASPAPFNDLNDWARAQGGHGHG